MQTNILSHVSIIICCIDNFQALKTMSMHGCMIRTLQMMSAWIQMVMKVTTQVSTMIYSLLHFLNSVNDPGTQAPLLDDICVEYHLHSGCKTEHFALSNFSHMHFPKSSMLNLDWDPWYPFCTQLDFEVVELALEAVLNKDQTEHLIKLLQCMTSMRSS